MMSASSVERAASVIVEACTMGSPIDGLPAECTPRDIEEAYAVQSAVFARRHGTAGGWFVAASNPEMQRLLGLKEPYSARWGSGRFLASGARVSAPGKLPMALEAEVTFRLGRDLPPRDEIYAAAEVLEAVDAAYPSIEVVISCFADWVNQAPLNLIAEGGAEQFLVLGEPLKDRSVDLGSLPVTVRVNDSIAARGNGGNVQGGPLRVLVWLANQASRRGIGLRSGELCNTGMCAPVCTLEPGDCASADFGVLGEVRLTAGDGGERWR